MKRLIVTLATVMLATYAPAPPTVSMAISPVDSTHLQIVNLVSGFPRVAPAPYVLELQSTTDFTNWTTITNLQFVGDFAFTNIVEATNGMMFFRAEAR